MPVSCQIGVQIPLRDGIQLAADVWAPLHQSSPLPTVISFTPYGRDGNANTASLFASWGFIFVIVDCRGRGESEGEFSFYGDGDDYAQAVQWIAEQSWSDGHVFTQGGSYAGINQWQVASRSPSALKAIAPMVAPMPGWDSDYWGGIGRNGNIDWCTLVQGRSAKWSLFSNADFWRQLHARVWREEHPRRGLTTLLTPKPNPLIAAIIRPFSKADWNYAVPNEQEMAELALPALSITGLYDDAQVGAILYFEQHEHATKNIGVNRRFLVVGPCVHAGTRPISHSDTENLEGAVLVSDRWQDELCAHFYRYVLGEENLPSLLAGRVNVFVSGMERWVHAPSVEALADQHLHLYPSENGLSEAPHSGQTTQFTSDPMDSRFADLEAAGKVGSTLGGLSCGKPLDTDFADERYLFEQGLIWDTKAFTDPVIVCGRPTLSLELSTDLPDADLLACLLKIHPDGRRVVLSTSMLRLRHRDGFDQPTRLMSPGVKERIEFPLWRLTATKLEPGSRLRLVLRVPASIDFERQMNSEKPVVDQRLTDAKVGAITVHLGASTQLRVPLLDPSLPQSEP